MKHNRIIPAAILAAALLSGCAAHHISADFGQAVRQEVAAQIADPDASYTGVPAPGSDGGRVGLAQKRYEAGEVATPQAAATTGK